MVFWRLTALIPALSCTCDTPSSQPRDLCVASRNQNISLFTLYVLLADPVCACQLIASPLLSPCLLFPHIVIYATQVEELRQLVSYVGLDRRDSQFVRLLHSSPDLSGMSLEQRRTMTNVISRMDMLTETVMRLCVQVLAIAGSRH